MKQELRYIDLSWAVVAVCGEAARRKIDRYIAEHPPVQPLPRFYIVLLQQPFAPMEPDGMTSVYQM